MQVIGLIIGILSFIGMFIFFLPFLGVLNWLNIPFAIIGFVIGIISIINTERKGIGIAGIVLCTIAIVVGGIRLMIGFFIL
jgi:hypothetical protein